MNVGLKTRTSITMLALAGCESSVIQEDDGSGYTVLNVSVPGQESIEVTVHE